ncbi:hypothetical protein BKA83DRAFT_4020813, partial [Pisolithus microcarpus]
HAIADLIALHQTLHMLADFLKTISIGAFPLLPSNAQGVACGPLTEHHLITETNCKVQFLYEKLKHIQGSSGVIIQHL